MDNSIIAQFTCGDLRFFILSNGDSFAALKREAPAKCRSEMQVRKLIA